MASYLGMGIDAIFRIGSLMLVATAFKMSGGIVRSAVWRAGAAVVIIGVIAVIDWRVELDVAFGFLYVFPLILVGTVLPRWGIALIAILCTSLADIFDPYPFIAGVSIPHDILVFTSLAGTGLFAHSVTRSGHLAQEAEEQLAFLVQTSPAAILTMTDEGEILLANTAAHRMFRVAPDALPSRNVARYIPTLGKIQSGGHILAPAGQADAATMQSAMQCRAERATGEGFLADVFFSTYGTAAGPRVAAVIIDVSEALREREISGLDQLMAGSRILVAAMFHEVRNLSSAMTMSYEALKRSGPSCGNSNFDALGALLATLSRVAAAELKQSAGDSEAAIMDLAEVLTDLRLVLDPYAEEMGVVLRWHIAPGLPPVWADRHRLLQVLLNLIRNSERALAEQEERRIDVTASPTGGVVSIRVTDNGPGLPSADHLFEPFQQEAESTGLGLYLSRALLRSFQGDLRYVPAGPGCSFAIELAVVRSQAEPPADGGGTDTHGTYPIAVG
jgi:PAS domain S-box-containing protein